MRVGVLGGTFDPPHLGHLGIGEVVLKSGLVDEVWFIPCYTHAFGKAPTRFEHRLNMCRLLIENHPHMAVCDIEKELDAPGRTVALLKALINRYPQNTFRIVAGADIYFERQKWYRFDLVEKLAPPIYIQRQGEPLPDVKTLPAPVKVSSSEIREKFDAQQDVRGLLLDNVHRYILNNRLYEAN